MFEAIQRVDLDRFDPEGPGDPGGSVFGLPYYEAESSVVLVPVPWDETTSYGRGTAQGPDAIRQASQQLDLFDLGLLELGLGEPWSYGIFMRRPDAKIVQWNEDAARMLMQEGGRMDGRALEAVNFMSTQLNALVEQQVTSLLDAGKIVGLVGGEHSVSFGAITSLAKKFDDFGILQIDAHADLRNAYEGMTHSHASIMRNVLLNHDEVEALVQVGIRDLSAGEYKFSLDDPRIQTFFDHHVRADYARWGDFCDRVVESLPEHVYITIDIDGLDPSLCPGTGTPVPGGLQYSELMDLLLAITRSKRKVIGFDVVEVAPSPHRPQWDGNVAARILYRLCGMALWSHGARDSFDETLDW